MPFPDLLPIATIAEQCGIDAKDIIPYGRYMAKLPLDYISEERVGKGKLILVTAITPNKAGVGKTVACISLSMGLNRIGKKVIAALREPSLGPSFGRKGGAAGGGAARVLPSEDINLHFTGDFHAITAANNMLAALLDNYRYRNPDKPLKEVFWRRVLDVNDRALRDILTNPGGQHKAVYGHTGFDITPASEIMALLCLAENLQDLEQRVNRIVLGFTEDGEPFTVNDLGVGTAITVLLKDAILPNLVQSSEHTPAIIHGGPFANIAHGCNSVIATKAALSHADYVVTEAGFGSDLGAEKFYNIKCRIADLSPAATVIVVTTGALKLHGGISEKLLSVPDIAALQKGMANLERYIENIRSFGQPVLVSLNCHDYDKEDEIGYIADWCDKRKVTFAVDRGFSQGGAGSADAAEKLVQLIAKYDTSALKFSYDLADSITVKIENIAQSVYRADGVEFGPGVLERAAQFEMQGWGNLPVCIAKTQYSFTDNPALINAPEGFAIHIRELLINAGAGFIVAIAGDILRMPGLPKVPNAQHIRLVEGKVEGLQ